MPQTHVADGVNNSISFFPAQQIAATDCSDRSVLSTVATLKLNVGAWIQESFGKLGMFCSNPIFKLQMYTIAQAWRVLPPQAAFLISGKTFQF